MTLGLLVMSKKYYAGGEVVTELLLTDSPDMHCQVIITDKKGNDNFKLGAKYATLFTEEVADGKFETG